MFAMSCAWSWVRLAASPEWSAAMSWRKSTTNGAMLQKLLCYVALLAKPFFGWWELNISWTEPLWGNTKQFLRGLGHVIFCPEHTLSIWPPPVWLRQHWQHLGMSMHIIDYNSNMVLEQPSGSFLPEIPRFQWLISVLKVHGFLKNNCFRDELYICET